MHRLIIEKFDEWTKGLDAKESRIKIFERIRDIPYGIIPGLIDPINGPIGILTYDRGSCSPKHFLLGIMFQKLNIPMKYATYPFYWNDPDIRYPEELRKLANEMPLENHIACKAYINGKWTLVDATWDLSLRKAGFPVNETWDGISDTLNAVKPIEEIIHENTRERIDYINSKKTHFTDQENTLRNIFFNEFNEWLNRVRRSLK